MLGTIRFLLASLVVMNHFWLPVANLTPLNLAESPISLIPPAWSLSVEVFFYDGLLGDLACPVFLSHFFAAGLVIAMFSPTLTWGPTTFFALTYGTTVLVSVLFLRGPERQVERVRNRIRQAARGGPAVSEAAT